jgi:hypothetical protein
MRAGQKWRQGEGIHSAQGPALATIVAVGDQIAIPPTISSPAVSLSVPSVKAGEFHLVFRFFLILLVILILISEVPSVPFVIARPDTSRSGSHPIKANQVIPLSANFAGNRPKPLSIKHFHRIQGSFHSSSFKPNQGKSSYFFDRWLTREMANSSPKKLCSESRPAGF